MKTKGARGAKGGDYKGWKGTMTVAMTIHRDSTMNTLMESGRVGDTISTY